MRILISSPAFHPRVGGLEIAVAQLALGLGQLGHDVQVITCTAAAPPEPFPFRVVRRPGALATLRLLRWCDVLVQANLSLREAWPLLVVRRPWVVWHHSWYRREDGRIAWQDRLKRFLLRYATSIAVSRAMADDLETPTLVIPNTYRDDLFRPLPEVARDKDLAFVGRLVSDKGVDVLLDALALLDAEGLRPDLTIIGDGPEAAVLHEQARRLGLEARVQLLGTRTGDELVRLLNAHRILVVPSRYREPFGIVALEGIACGCIVVGSEGGGLAEAIGECGRTFPNGDARALAEVLADLLRHPEGASSRAAQVADHLAHHASRRAAAAFAAVLEGVVQDRREGGRRG